MLLDLTNSDKKAIVDDKNYDRVMEHKWYWKKSGENSYYVATNISKTTVYLHRFILDPSPNKDVHHKDENTLNNLEENLEEVPAIMHRSWHNRNRRFKDVTKGLCQECKTCGGSKVVLNDCLALAHPEYEDCPDCQEKL